MSKITLTGVKPTGMPHLGNYIGAIRPALRRASQAGPGQSFLFIADYHSLTSVQNPTLLRQMVREVSCAWLACGLNPQKTLFYRQSDISELFEMNWLLSCLTPKGLMNRGHSYKALIQAAEGSKNPDAKINMGIYNYPILMAADILLFSADEVPVSEDQKQHLEIARDIALKFNRIFNRPLLKEPQALISGPVLPGTDGRKMSKSYGNHIPLFLPPAELRKKVMSIKTDSLPPEAPKTIQNSTLFALYRAFASEEKTKALTLRYKEGISWGEVKELLYEELEAHLTSQRSRYQEWMQSPDRLNNLLKEGAHKARLHARSQIQKIRQVIGID